MPLSELFLISISRLLTYLLAMLFLEMAAREPRLLMFFSWIQGSYYNAKRGRMLVFLGKNQRFSKALILSFYLCANLSKVSRENCFF